MADSDGDDDHSGAARFSTQMPPPLLPRRTLPPRPPSARKQLSYDVVHPYAHPPLLTLARPSPAGATAAAAVIDDSLPDIDFDSIVLEDASPARQCATESELLTVPTAVKDLFGVAMRSVQARALGCKASADDGIDAVELKAWLPSPDELTHLAANQTGFGIMFQGACHPSILCAMLYTRMGAWDEAATIAEGVLALSPNAMHHAVRIEAWQLLARCRGTAGDTAAAREALPLRVPAQRGKVKLPETM